MKEIARYLGENPDTDEFKDAMLALDLNNDGNISITEFVSWWKIGRQSCKALPKIYHLKKYVSESLANVINFKNYVMEISKIKLQEKENSIKSVQNVNFIGPGAFKWRSNFDLNLCLGGTERLRNAENFLSVFTKNYTAAAKANWVSILFNNLNENICSEQEAVTILNGFKDHIIKWCEDNQCNDFAEFIKNLLLFESSSATNSAVLAIRFKVDIEDLIKLALEDLIFILKNLAPEKSSHEFTMNFKSNEDFLINSLEGKNIGQFLEICEMNIKNSGFRDRLKCLVSNLNKEAIQNIISIVQFLFVPLNLNVKYNGNINDFVDESTKAFLNIPLTNIGKSLQFLVKNLGEKLLKSTNDISIALNCFGSFIYLKFYCYSFSK